MQKTHKNLPRISFSLLLTFSLLFIFSANSFAQKERKIRINGKTVTHKPRPVNENRNIPCGLSEFRRIDGTCNNLTNPDRYEWGAADVELAREMDEYYGLPDDLNDMSGQNRLTPRAISNLVVRQTEDMPSGIELSSLVFSWGQFLDHDIDLTPEGHTEYAPVILPANEPLFTYDIPFFRSEVRAGTGVTNYRQQSNIITSWIDASNVYGSEETRAEWLRTFQDGKLKTSSGNLLPFNTVDGEFDSAIDPDAPSMAGDENGTVVTFVAGDIRAAEQPGLTSLHTLFVREHNRICEVLKRRGINNDEQLYQLARKEVGALMQAITYNEFLPALGIELSNNDRYIPDELPNIRNVFATAAYRLGHTMVTDEILLRGDRCNPVGEGEVSLIDGFFNPEIVKTNDIDPILKGLSMQVQQEVDVKIIDNLRNFLFALQGQPGNFGLDLASLNLQRGRDHGLPDYNTIRAHYLGDPVQSFNQITIDNDLQAALERAYGDVNNIDAWIGLLAEDHINRASVGPTLNAILKHQFELLRDGDFYYYERDPYLDRRTRDDVSRTTLSDVIERNTSLTNLSNNVFEANACERGGGRGDGRGDGNDGGRSLNSNSNATDAGINSGISVAGNAVEGVLNIYPNPTDGLINLSLKESELRSANLSIESLQGKTLMKLDNMGVDGFIDLQLDLSGWPAGIYLINIQTPQKRYSQKLILD